MLEWSRVYLLVIIGLNTVNEDGTLTLFVLLAIILIRRFTAEEWWTRAAAARKGPRSHLHYLFMILTHLFNLLLLSLHLLLMRRN